MPKVSLDMNTFKALASDTRLNILKSLDGKKMNLKDICKATNLNKATLHEHLSKLHEAGLVKRKERKGHKWVYYKLSWKGESLIHPENTRVVVLFSATFIALAAGIIQMIQYVQGKMVSIGYNLWEDQYQYFDNGGRNILNSGNVSDIPKTTSPLTGNESIPITFGDELKTHGDELNIIYQDPKLLYIALICFAIFTTVLSISLWRYWKNKSQKL